MSNNIKKKLQFRLILFLLKITDALRENFYSSARFPEGDFIENHWYPSLILWGHRSARIPWQLIHDLRNPLS